MNRRSTGVTGWKRRVFSERAWLVCLRLGSVHMTVANIGLA